jgi:hypothetical protein
MSNSSRTTSPTIAWRSPAWLSGESVVGSVERGLTRRAGAGSPGGRTRGPRARGGAAPLFGRGFGRRRLVRGSRCGGLVLGLGAPNPYATAFDLRSFDGAHFEEHSPAARRERPYGTGQSANDGNQLQRDELYLQCLEGLIIEKGLQGDIRMDVDLRAGPFPDKLLDLILPLRFQETWREPGE